MMPASSKMICPNCRVEMNHHGDKLMQATDSQQTVHMHEAVGGAVEEFHTCPKCGRGGSRHAGA
jgi:ribosomal protein S27AE